MSYTKGLLLQTSEIAAVIPAYNAETTLVEVICNLRTSLPNLPIIVINDGSEDATGRKAKSMNVIYLEHSRNRGKGAALKTGIRRALAMNHPTYILTLDADNQHSPRFVPEMLRKIKEDSHDIVVGSRMWNMTPMPLHRILSNKITSKLISWRVGQRIIDSQCGFRLFPTNLVRRLKLDSDRFDFESEFLIRAALAGLRIGFVKIDAVYTKNQVSHIKIVDLFRFIRLYLRSFAWKRNEVK